VEADSFALSNFFENMHAAVYTPARANDSFLKRRNTMARTVAVFAAFLMLGLVGCKSEPEKAASDMADKQKEIVSILKGVKDKDSAVAAKAKLQAVAKDMSELAAKWDKKKLKDAEMDKAMEKYKPEMEQSGKELRAEMERISKIPEAMGPIMEGMMSMGTSGMGLEP
jgi:hypothetical protein